jgi:hypothetical protein
MRTSGWAHAGRWQESGLSGFRKLTHGKKFDLLLVRFDKAAAKEQLRYRDFPLNEKRFYWQSKARTTPESPEGRRHLDPARYSVTPLLFVRERADERAGVTMAFRYLGPVERTFDGFSLDDDASIVQPAQLDADVTRTTSTHRPGQSPNFAPGRS